MAQDLPKSFRHFDSKLCIFPEEVANEYLKFIPYEEAKIIREKGLLDMETLMELRDDEGFWVKLLKDHEDYVEKQTQIVRNHRFNTDFIENISDANLDPEKPVFVDTETNGLYGRITLLQLYQRDTVFLMKNPIDGIKRYLKNYHLVFHNAAYDLTCLDFPEAHFSDTFLAGRLKFFYRNKFAFNIMLKYIYGVDPYEVSGMVKKDMQKTDWCSGELTEDQIKYAAFDVYYLKELWEEVKDTRKQKSYILDKETVRDCIRIQKNGIPILRDAVNKEIEETEDRLIDLPINPNSYMQVRKYLNSETSDRSALTKMIREGSKDAAEVLQARQAKSGLTKLKKYTGKVFRGHFSPAAITGRLTSSKENLQQIPRAYKKLFGSVPGKVLVYSDFSQLELRCVCALINEKKMISLFREGEDVHSYFAKVLLNRDSVTSEERTLAKAANFGLLYGMGARRFQEILFNDYNIKKTLKQSEKVRNVWLDTWKDIAKFHRSGSKAFRNGDCWQTPLGRKYKATKFTDQLNYRVQGFGADVTKMAMHYICKKYSKEMCLNIHDAYVLNISENYYKDCAKYVAESMKKSWKENCKKTKVPDVPLPVEVFVGNNWGTIEKEYIYKYEMSKV